MTASSARRAFAVVALAAVTVMAAPGVPVAFADASPAPDFATSYFTAGGDDVTLAAVLARSGHALTKPSQVAVAFTSPVSLTRNDYTLDPTGLLPQVINAPAPYFIETAAPATHLAATATADPAHDDRVLVAPSAPLTDGTYELHVSVFAKTGCDVPFGTIGGPPACPSYDDFVNEPGGSTPFAFTVDSLGPLVHITSVNGGLSSITATHVKSVVISGTAQPDTKSLALTIKSSTGGGTRFAAATVTGPAGAGQPATWTSTVDLSNLPDGTLTITAIGTDYAGNKTDLTDASRPDPDARRTIPLRAHPSQPRSFAARSKDAGAQLSWLPPLSTGGHPITGYVVSAADTTAGTAPVSKALSCSGSCPSAFLASGLTNGHRYTVSVAATTDVGKGAAALTTVRPRAATTLTAKPRHKIVAKGHRARLSGRLTRTRTASGIGGVTLKITPKFASGRTGKVMKVVTDTFGVWHKSFTPLRSAYYVVRYAGSLSTLPAKARTHVTLR
ncbi:MAG: hypothetical protein QOJ03_481 [Frankiaceae bacterium]|nr:hypothetical protein [Frankiaceae bacterium]